MEVAAWVQVAVGVAALILTALTATPAINAILQQAASGSAASSPLHGTQGAIQLFAIALVVSTSLVFVSIGVAVILGHLFIMIKSSYPYHAAFCVVTAMILLPVGATIGILGNKLWMWPVLQAVLCILLAGQSQADPGKETFWGLMIVGTIACFFVGLMATGLT